MALKKIQWQFGTEVSVLLKEFQTKVNEKQRIELDFASAPAMQSAIHRRGAEDAEVAQSLYDIWTLVRTGGIVITKNKLARCLLNCD